MRHLLASFDQKRREGKGVQKVAVQNSAEKGAFRTLFRVRLFGEDQGARSRGWERFWPELKKGVLRVLEDPQDRCPDLKVLGFPATFLSKG